MPTILFKKGQTPWNKGKKTSEEVIQKLKTSHLGQKPWNKGKKTPKAVIKKLRESHLGQVAWNKGVPHSVPGVKGAKHYNWKGGVTSENSRIRYSWENVYWRKMVFIRDEFTCQFCNVSGGYLVVHHINNFAEFPELRFEISNGITLHKSCHLNFHKKYGFRNNTVAQIQEFISSNNG